MCQAIAQGGRRCPIHRRETLIVSQSIQEKTGLKDKQVRQLFSELRREGRHSPYEDEQYWNAYLDSLRLRSDVSDAVRREVEIAREENDLPDAATLYALRRFQDRAVQRGRALMQTINSIAERKGWSEAEAQEKFNSYYQSVSTSRSAPVPEEFTASRVRAARNADLPYDRQTVVALAKMEDEQVDRERVPRVQRVPMRSTNLAEAGFSEGRLEVVFHSSPDRVYAYRNVPEGVWEEMSNSTSPGRVYMRQVRGNPAYRYSSAEEAGADAYRLRCTGCGQFIAASGGHTCPVHEEAAEAAAEATHRSIFPVEEAANEEQSSQEQEPRQDVPEGMNQEAVQAQLYPPTVPVPEPVLEFHEQVEGYPASTRIICLKGRDVGTALHILSHDELSDEDKETLMKAPSSTTMVIGYAKDEHGNLIPASTPGANGEIGYKRKITFVSQNNAHVFERDGTSGLIKVYPATPHPAFEYEGGEEQYRAERRAEISSLRESIRDGSVVHSTQIATAKEFHVDGNASQPAKVRWASARDVRKAVAEGKAVTSSVEWQFGRRRGGLTGSPNPLLDDQGYPYPDFSSGSRVTGNLTMQRKADGTMEVVRSTRTLRCDCFDYRRNYHCAHVDYVQRHAANMGQQMLEQRSAAPRAARRPVQRVDTPLGPVPQSFYSRADVEIEHDSEIGHYVNLSLGNYRERNSLMLASKTSGFDTSTEDGKRELMYAHMLNNMSVSTPGPALLNQALRYGPVQIPVSTYMASTAVRIPYGTVTGSVMLKKEDDNTVVVSRRTLRCNCFEYRRDYDCVHVRALNQANFASLTETHQDVAGGNRLSEEFSELVESMGHRERRDWGDALTYNCAVADAREVREQRNAQIAREEMEARQRIAESRQRELAEAKRSLEEKIAEVRENSALHRQRIEENWAKREPGYAENPGEFYEDYREALRLKESGEPAIPFKTENVTDGICADQPGGRGFGVELEFKIRRGVNKSAALTAIAQDLYDAGLTWSERQEEYHTASRQPEGSYAKWSFEKDDTVDGELVSPVLKDTPEHWEQLRTAVEIIKKHGGQASTSAGSHVHISTASYENSTAKHAELLRLVSANEDVLYRMASNPTRGKHRGTQYCRPNVRIRNEEFTKDGSNAPVDEVLMSQYRSSVVNTAHSGNSRSPNSSRVEFRVWDSTLDPGVIQQQIVLSAAMTERAERTVEITGTSKPPEKYNPLGTAKSKGGAGGTRTKAQQTQDEFLEESGHAGQFIDSLFRRKEDRKRATALFAINNWADRL